jgi:hypothetical protein
MSSRNSSPNFAFVCWRTDHDSSSSYHVTVVFGQITVDTRDQACDLFLVPFIAWQRRLQSSKKESNAVLVVDLNALGILISDSQKSSAISFAAWIGIGLVIQDEIES